jgi:hypothetical protein
VATSTRIVNRRGRTIATVPDWERHAAPASTKHWKDGRSAKELAKAWVAGDGQTALVRLLDGREETSGLVIDEAVAEAQVAFDQYRGGKRNHDLLIQGRCGSGSIVIGLEAKADETFGQTLAEYDASAQKIRAAGGSTNAPERLTELMEGIAFTTLDRTPTFGDLRYQLFAGVAGTLAAAGDADLAAFIIHEFATELTTAKRRRQNRLDFAKFIGDVTGAIPPEDDCWLLGPFYMPDERWLRIPLFLGHLTTTPTQRPTG